MRVASLHVHPLKGCHRVDVDTAEVEPWGLAGDRRWLIVDADGGRAVTQREVPRLATVRPTPVPGGLVLRTPGQPDLDVAAPGASNLGRPVDSAGGDQVSVELFRQRYKAARVGAAADAWLSAALDRDVRLTYLDDPEQRPVDPGYAGPGDTVSFADAYPVLVANTASLDALNGWLDEPVPMTRFRPNVVVTGFPAWAEDGWTGGRLRIGALTFRVPKPCDRCVVTTVDQESGEKGREPLHTLGRMRRFPGGLMFAVHLIPDGTGRIAVGDPVSVL